MGDAINRREFIKASTESVTAMANTGTSAARQTAPSAKPVRLVGIGSLGFYHRVLGMEIVKARFLY